MSRPSVSRNDDISGMGLYSAFFFHGVVVHDDPGMENLLLDLLSEVVAHSPDEHALRERRDFRRRNKTVELGVYRRRGIAAVDAHGQSFLHDLSESFGGVSGPFLLRPAR